ncbi:ABC transporter permease [Aureimonas fodinaquatilis]|uniref:ABC transporter permease n=1 Tax=Aureimonas fodinaquatilis TaxID=2565783 RepID=A0A5B0DS50_9HYPH|nr:ABC transporter permease [Aureimonas fodinaquatilis]KAA0969326.1 ABC transporter permease [Aureimonas fodinaquatilis]
MSDLTLPAAQEEDTVWVKKASWIDRVPRPIAMALLFVAFITLWQLATSNGLVSPIVLPTPWRTAQDIVFVGQNLLSGTYMLSAFLITAQEVAWGFVIAVVLGAVLGILVGETAFGERAVMPYIVAIDTMPKIAFAPLFVAWLGFGISSKVALAAFVSIFPVIVGTAAGLHAADNNARMLFQSIGASRLQTLIRLKIPAGLPHFFTGVKIASVSVVAGAIAAEFLGGGKGFGELIRVAASQLDTPRVFSLILYLSLLGSLMYGLVIWAQRRLVFWHKSTAAEQAER